jgi:hypothetical protein
VSNAAIEGVFKYVLNHNFLKFLYSALVDAGEDDAQMHREVDKVSNSIFYRQITS